MDHYYDMFDLLTAEDVPRSKPTAGTVYGWSDDTTEKV